MEEGFPGKDPSKNKSEKYQKNASGFSAHTQISQERSTSLQNSLIPLRFNHLLENVSLCLSSSSNRRPGVRHSTFESLRLGCSSQSIASGFHASGIP
ncbi:hypothetical protein YC2023_085135 [Brassica napus]